jgi:adenylyltransferase/sulfurtransferase
LDLGFEIIGYAKQDMTEDAFVIDDDDRYSRLRLIAWWDQVRLANARVLVVGAGALGNEVLKNLALLGVGNVYVVDFDLIEESNLSRSVLFRSRDRGRSKAEAAADALRDLNPDTKVQPLLANVITEIGLGLFRDVDVVIGCLDNREARLWVNRSCWKVNTPWIDGGIQEINGVVKTFQPPDGSCYECAMTETDYRLINLRYSCPLLRQEDLQAGKVPTAPTISSMIGALQTQEALKLIHGMPVASGEALIYNGIANQFYKTRFQHREDCLSHETYDELLPLPLTCEATTGEQLMAAVAEATGDEGPWRITLDRDLVVRIDCARCGANSRIMRPMQAVGMRDAVCPECEETGRPDFVQHVDQGSELAKETLSNLGVPSYDIVKVQGGKAVHYALLDGDRDDWRF